jgi:hypothetical protein
VARSTAVVGLVAGAYKHIEERSTIGTSTIDAEAD